ncbi:hypothetical protein L1049_000213 [Liquidambar formosana]|uniref:Uncharacterized protein n=1 Tax=Liquidambar formosana TaxID=63359 RepID=A0AAP0NA61_LIQFO
MVILCGREGTATVRRGNPSSSSSSSSASSSNPPHSNRTPIPSPLSIPSTKPTSRFAYTPTFSAELNTSPQCYRTDGNSNEIPVIEKLRLNRARMFRRESFCLLCLIPFGGVVLVKSLMTPLATLPAPLATTTAGVPLFEIFLAVNKKDWHNNVLSMINVIRTPLTSSWVRVMFLKKEDGSKNWVVKYLESLFDRPNTPRRYLAGELRQ